MKRRMIGAVALLLVALNVCGCMVSTPGPTDPTSEPIVTTEPATEPTMSTTEQTVSATETVLNEYPWLAEPWESLPYEEYFSEDRPYKPYNLYSMGHNWVQQDDVYYQYWDVTDDAGNTVTYGLGQYPDGFYICEMNGLDEADKLYYVPGTENVDMSTAFLQFVSNGRTLLCVRNSGELLSIDLVSGDTEILYSADHILGDLCLATRDVLYFLSEANGILCLNRIYLPSRTVDLLYAQTSPGVPVDWYDLKEPQSSQSVIEWETMNPDFWKFIQEIIQDPEHPLGQTEGLLGAFNMEYIEAYPFELSVQHDSSLLQNEINLRPRLCGIYDPRTDTYTELFGIYDICFFGTSIHDDSEHFAPYPEYDPDE